MDEHFHELMNFRNVALAEISICFILPKSLFPADAVLLVVGELADGFRTRLFVFEETPPTWQVCNACKGVVRECWLQNRNDTCRSAFGDDAVAVEFAG